MYTGNVLVIAIEKRPVLGTPISVLGMEVKHGKSVIWLFLKISL